MTRGRASQGMEGQRGPTTSDPLRQARYNVPRQAQNYSKPSRRLLASRLFASATATASCARRLCHTLPQTHKLDCQTPRPNTSASDSESSTADAAVQIETYPASTNYYSFRLRARGCAIARLPGTHLPRSLSCALILSLSPTPHRPGFDIDNKR